MSTATQSSPSSEAILGVSARLVVEPRTVAEAAGAMRSFAGDKLAVAFVGGGTEIELGAAPTRLDAVLRTRQLARTIEYAPSDQIVAVEAGMTLTELQSHLASNGQRLALDPPLPDRATLGGIVAANSFGPLRTRFGAARDLVIGATLIRADGTIAKGGGKVVKNVAGFDLPRVICGSLGTLGLIAELIFRLHPRPETSATVVIDGLSAAETRAISRFALDARLEPSAVAALSDGARYRLLMRFEGFAPGVRQQTDRLLADVRRAAERLEGIAAATEWARHDAHRTSGDVRIKSTFPPASLEQAEMALRAVGSVLDEGRLVLYPTLGIAFVAGTLRDPAATEAALRIARTTIASERGHTILTAAPPSLRSLFDEWGPTPPGFEVMRRLKDELDPERRLSPGRFVGGL